MAKEILLATMLVSTVGCSKTEELTVVTSASLRQAPSPDGTVVEVLAPGARVRVRRPRFGGAEFLSVDRGEATLHLAAAELEVGRVAPYPLRELRAHVSVASTPCRRAPDASAEPVIELSGGTSIGTYQMPTDAPTGWAARIEGGVVSCFLLARTLRPEPLTAGELRELALEQLRDGDLSRASALARAALALDPRSDDLRSLASAIEGAPSPGGDPRPEGKSAGSDLGKLDSAALARVRDEALDARRYALAAGAVRERIARDERERELGRARSALAASPGDAATWIDVEARYNAAGRPGAAAHLAEVRTGGAPVHLAACHARICDRVDPDALFLLASVRRGRFEASFAPLERDREAAIADLAPRLAEATWFPLGQEPTLLPAGELRAIALNEMGGMTALALGSGCPAPFATTAPFEEVAPVDDPAAQERLARVVAKARQGRSRIDPDEDVLLLPGGLAQVAVGRKKWVLVDSSGRLLRSSGGITELDNAFGWFRLWAGGTSTLLGFAEEIEQADWERAEPEPGQGDMGRADPGPKRRLHFLLLRAGEDYSLLSIELEDCVHYD